MRNFFNPTGIPPGTQYEKNQSGTQTSLKTIAFVVSFCYSVGQIRLEKRIHIHINGYLSNKKSKPIQEVLSKDYIYLTMSQNQNNTQ
jgi:hypothetical protein